MRAAIYTRVSTSDRQQRKGERVEGAVAVRLHIQRDPDGEPDHVRDDEPHPAGVRSDQVADTGRHITAGQRL
jgi:hypothetical protein